MHDIDKEKAIPHASAIDEAEHHVERMEKRTPRYKPAGVEAVFEGFFSRVSDTVAFLKGHFALGKPHYFATLGLAIFLLLSPLVIYRQKELVEKAVVLFIGFIAISYWNKLDNRVMIVTALLFLLSCPFLLIMKEDARAELSAIYAYYALCAGVFLQFVDYLQNREKHEKEEEKGNMQEDEKMYGHDGEHGQAHKTGAASTLPDGKK